MPPGYTIQHVGWREYRWLDEFGAHHINRETHRSKVACRRAAWKDYGDRND